jgi:hypothetical protein
MRYRPFDLSVHDSVLLIISPRARPPRPTFSGGRDRNHQTPRPPTLMNLFKLSKRILGVTLCVLEPVGCEMPGARDSHTQNALEILFYSYFGCDTPATRESSRAF